MCTSVSGRRPLLCSYCEDCARLAKRQAFLHDQDLSHDNFTQEKRVNQDKMLICDKTE